MISHSDFWMLSSYIKPPLAASEPCCTESDDDGEASPVAFSPDFVLGRQPHIRSTSGG